MSFSWCDRLQAGIAGIVFASPLPKVSHTHWRVGDKCLHRGRIGVIGYIAPEGSDCFQEPWANIMLSDGGPLFVNAALRDLHEIPDPNQLALEIH